MQFIPTPGYTLNNNNQAGVLTESVQIHFIFELQETYNGPYLFPTPESFNSVYGFKINFSTLPSLLTPSQIHLAIYSQATSGAFSNYKIHQCI